MEWDFQKIQLFILKCINKNNDLLRILLPDISVNELTARNVKYAKIQNKTNLLTFKHMFIKKFRKN